MTDNNIGYDVGRCDGETFGHTPVLRSCAYSEIFLNL